MDYKKFLYDQKKKQKEIKAKTSKVVVKEVRLGPNTDDHDFNFKLNHAKKFLEDGAKVKVEVFFKGRTIVYKDKGELMMLKFAQELEDYGKVEKLPLLEKKRQSGYQPINNNSNAKDENESQCKKEILFHRHRQN